MTSEDSPSETCPACGTQVRQTDSVCLECGLTLSPEALPEEVGRCPLCGREISEGTARCECGYDVYGERAGTDVASTSRRFLNCAIDSALCAVVGRVLLNPGVEIVFENIADRVSPSTAGFLMLPFVFLGFLSWFAMVYLYYFLCESRFQRTLGKLVTRTAVVTIGGGRPSSGAIAKRTLIRFVPFEPLSGGFGAWWHDIWTQTRVVTTSTNPLTTRASTDPA